MPSSLLINVGSEGGSWQVWVWKSKGSDRVKSDVAAIPGRRTHVALVVEGQQYRLYVNGRQAVLKPGKALPLRSGAAPFEIGFQFNGIVDEVRVSKSARYDRDFTPQVRFIPDSETLGLYHCDEGTGGRLIDSSGNSHHGRINGATWVKVGGGAAGTAPNGSGAAK